MRIVKQSARKRPRLSLILLDWGVRESFHLRRRTPGGAAAGMNPLVHYVLFGARAGRWPNASHGLELTHQS